MVLSSTKIRTKALPNGAQPLRIGDVVQDGDYMQIGSPPSVSYFPACTPQTCRLNAQGIDCGGVGHRVEHSGEPYWRLGSAKDG